MNRKLKVLGYIIAAVSTIVGYYLDDKRLKEEVKAEVEREFSRRKKMEESN